ncbi:MAG TPA: tellurium resistance protein TerY, partial [Fibrobacteria bacterium]|nr:tellurium resistance protein TerY [Fibrobacteria bacterium]
KAANPGVVVCCAAGPQASTEALERISQNVVKLDAADFPYIKAFFKWVSSSIASTSRKVDGRTKEIAGLMDLPPPPSNWGGTP